jgi:D-glycero-D-manno-heptose 1,7-bisphosphate phosphatase
MCAHYPQGKEGLKEQFLIQNCNCRKPKPGLLKKAMEKFNVDLERSFMVGDSHVDV